MNNANGGTVYFKFKGDTTELEQSVNDVKSSLNVKDLVKADLISSAIKGIAGKVAGLASSVAGIGTSVVKLAATGGMDRALNIEQARFKLQGLGHDATETQQIMDNALASVKGTAYGLDEAATVAASAVAAGVKPGQELERTLKLVGDAATISGRDLSSMGAIFNKIAANGKITGEELNQLADSGIPILQLLADSMGKTTAEVRDLVSNGKVGFNEFQKAIEKGMGGAALTMGQTFNGALSNMKAALSRIGADVMKPLSESLTPIMGTLTGIFDAIESGNTENLDNLFNNLETQITAGVNNVIKVLGPLIQRIIPIVGKLLKTLGKTIIDNLPAIFEMLKSIGEQILSFVPPLITSVSTQIVNSIPTIMSGITTLITNIITGIVNLLPTIITGIANVITSIAQALPTMIPQIVQAILDGLLAILDNIDLIIDAGIQLILGLGEGLINALPIIIEKLPEIVTKIAQAIIRNLPKIVDAGMKLIVKLGEGILKAIPKLIVSIGKAALNIGSSLIEGIGKGITSGIEWLKKRIKEMVGNVMNFITKLFKIGSPSKLMAEDVGQWIPKGIAVGIDANTDSVYDSMSNMENSLMKNFTLDPALANSLHYSPNVIVNNNVSVESDPLGQTVRTIKTFSGGAKNDYNYGMGV